MKTNKKKAGQDKPNTELKGTEKIQINNALANAEGDPDEVILCVPGGKCYTRAELEALETSDMPLFQVEGEHNDAEK